MRLPLMMSVVALVPAAASDDFRAVAAAGNLAWTKRDPVGLAAVVHPELVERLRRSPLLANYLEEQGHSSNALVAIARRRDGDRSSLLDRGGLDRLPTAELLELFCQALSRKSRPERESVSDVWVDGLAQDELALCTFTHAVRWGPGPDGRSSRPNDVVLKRHDGRWRWLWSRVAQPQIDPEWDPSRQFVPLTIVMDGRTDCEIVGVKAHVSAIARHLRLLPGTYEVVGRRQGFREVRWLISVSPDAPPLRVTVSCTVPE